MSSRHRRTSENTRPIRPEPSGKRARFYHHVPPTMPTSNHPETSRTLTHQPVCPTMPAATCGCISVAETVKRGFCMVLDANSTKSDPTAIDACHFCGFAQSIHRAEMPVGRRPGSPRPATGMARPLPVLPGGVTIQRTRGGVMLRTGDLQLTVAALLRWANEHDLRLHQFTARAASLQETFLALAESRGRSPRRGVGRMSTTARTARRGCSVCVVPPDGSVHSPGRRHCCCGATPAGSSPTLATHPSPVVPLSPRTTAIWPVTTTKVAC